MRSHRPASVLRRTRTPPPKGRWRVGRAFDSRHPGGRRQYRSVEGVGSRDPRQRFIDTKETLTWLLRLPPPPRSTSDHASTWRSCASGSPGRSSRLADAAVRRRTARCTWRTTIGGRWRSCGRRMRTTSRRRCGSGAMRGRTDDGAERRAQRAGAERGRTARSWSTSPAMKADRHRPGARRRRACRRRHVRRPRGAGAGARAGADDRRHVVTVGIGGLATGGGIGFMARKYGLTIDNLLSAQVVTAHGEIVTASPRRERGPVLGDPRRRRELRHRHGVRVPARAGGRGARRERWCCRRRARTCAAYLDYMPTAPDGLTTLVNI